MKKFTTWVVVVSLLLCLFFVDAVPISYAAEQPLTKGELALLLMENLELEYDSSMTIPYEDVPESSPYYEAVCVCHNTGIMNDGSTWFSVNQLQTRNSLANYLYKTGLPSVCPDIIPSDVYTSAYAKLSVIALNIMSVRENGLFDGYSFAYASDINFTALRELYVHAISSAVKLDLVNGSIDIFKNVKGETVFLQGETAICTTAASGIIRQTDNATATKNFIAVYSGTIELTISDLNIAPDSAAPISVEKGACLTLTLLGKNILTAPSDTDNAGIYVPDGAELQIRGTGSLDATGGSDILGGAGIGGGQEGGCGVITISGGTVTATSSGGGAGIGGGHVGDGGVITISGGTVTATSGSGAGIGGGHDGDGGIITISGGTVTAVSNNSGAGIGGGQDGDCGVITISGGTVTATSISGAGIGGGNGGNSGVITISGGTVTATSRYGAGIGGGDDGFGGVVKISNATVTATGYYWAIGGGDDTNEYGCESIDIEDSATVDFSCDSRYGYGECQEKIDVNNQSVESTAHIGNRAEFSVDAYGYSGLSYQWQVSSNNSTWTDIEGQTAAVGASLPLSEENNGYFYRCKLTNGWGNVVYSDPAQAYVLAFTKQPENVDANLDDIVSFAVTTSCKNVTFQWERSYDDGQTWLAVDGEIYPTLAVNATLSASSAKYRCVITATNGDTLASDIVEINLDTGNLVTYTAQYFLQKADGSGYVLESQMVIEGLSGETATAPGAAYDGFSENTAKSKASGTIANDSSLILTRYYDRNTYSISFEMNGGSTIPAIETLYEAPVTTPDEPSRYGYNFVGWYADEDFEEEYVFDNMPLNGATVYAKWELIGAERGVEYHINGITLRSGDTYEVISSIPNSSFFVDVSVTNVCANATDTVILAYYKENGQYIGMQYLKAKTQFGQTLTFGTYVENKNGDISKVKAFVLPALGSPVPLANSVEISK